MSFQNLFKSWESQNVLVYEVFFGAEPPPPKKKKPTLNLSFQQLGPCANVNLHQPFPQALPMTQSISLQMEL